MKTKLGEIRIIEAKGSLSSDGSSNNVDKYPMHKFEEKKVMQVVILYIIN